MSEERKFVLSEAQQVWQAWGNNMNMKQGVILGPKMGQTGPKWDISGTFFNMKRGVVIQTEKINPLFVQFVPF